MRFAAGQGLSTQRPNRKRAVDDMTKVLSKSLGVEISSEVVSKLFREKWRVLSDLAHAIHDGIE